jgi:small subunit ribosomal protein S14
MAKKSMIARQNKRQKLVLKHKQKRQHLKTLIQNTDFLDKKLKLYIELQKLPRNSSGVRLNNRCMITGRPKAYYRDFGLSRQVLREMAHQCLLPGLTKSSW